MVKIELFAKSVHCEFSGNTPCMLADKIKKVVEDFYPELMAEFEKMNPPKPIQ